MITSPTGSGTRDDCQLAPAGTAWTESRPAGCGRAGNRHQLRLQPPPGPESKGSTTQGPLELSHPHRKPNTGASSPPREDHRIPSPSGDEHGGPSPPGDDRRLSPPPREDHRFPSPSGDEHGGPSPPGDDHRLSLPPRDDHRVPSPSGDEHGGPSPPGDDRRLSSPPRDDHRVPSLPFRVFRPDVP